MRQRTFHVRAIWDDASKRYYSESDILGLHIESDSLDEFEEVLVDVATEVIFSNHTSSEDLASTPLKDLVPTIVWERPQERAA